MGTRVVINDRGLDQRGTDGTSTLEINVPLTLNSTTNTGGNMGIGVDAGVGKAIGSLTLTSGGSGYTNGTYSQVALTTVTGSGSGATADIVVAGGIVTTVVLRNPGQGYAVSDTLSCASIGAGSNFLLTVATTASILRSDGTVIAPRIGAGTTTPRAGVDVAAGGVLISAFADVVTTATSSSSVYSTALNISGTFTGTGTKDGFGITVFPKLALGNNGSWGGGILTRGTVESSTTGGGSWSLAMWAIAQRYSANDTATDLQQYSVVGATNITTGVGSATTAASACVIGSIFFNVATHTVTNAYWFDGQGTSNSNVTNFYGLRLRALAGSGVITNRWGVSQEDATAFNVYAGRSAIGQAAGTAATALADVGASTTARASLRIRSGAAPTSPNDGDIWYDGSFLYMRVGASTLKFTMAP